MGSTPIYGSVFQIYQSIYNNEVSVDSSRVYRFTNSLRASLTRNPKGGGHFNFSTFNFSISEFADFVKHRKLKLLKSR